MEFDISPIGASECGELAILLGRVISDLPYYSDRAKVEEIGKYSESELRDSVDTDSDSVIVARDNGRIVGFCISKYDDGLIWLSWFATDAAYRGRGIGGQLLAALGKTLPHRRAHKLWCDTRTDNVASQHVLERFGFRRIAELTNHWYGQDFFLWEWLPE